MPCVNEERNSCNRVPNCFSWNAILRGAIGRVFAKSAGSTMGAWWCQGGQTSSVSRCTGRRAVRKPIKGRSRGCSAHSRAPSARLYGTRYPSASRCAPYDRHPPQEQQLCPQIIASLADTVHCQNFGHACSRGKSFSYHSSNSTRSPPISTVPIVSSQRGRLKIVLFNHSSSKNEF